MADKKINFALIKEKAKHVGEGVKDAAGKAVEGAKDGAEKVAQFANAAKLEYDKNRLKPVFKEDYESRTNKHNPMIRLIEADKAHEESPACAGSIGFITPTKELDVLNLYIKDADVLGITYYPMKQEDVYYIDPTDSNLYISLDDYFDYLKKARVDELVMIAHSLGAKHVHISLKKNAKTFVDKKAIAEAGVGKKGKANAKAEQSEHKAASLVYEKKVDFEGGEPKTPELRYFANEAEIVNLINMRVNEHNPVKHWESSFKYSNSSGIKEDAAIKIDNALAKMKIKGNASVVYEAQREDRMEFQYEMDFE